MSNATAKWNKQIYRPFERNNKNPEHGTHTRSKRDEASDGMEKRRKRNDSKTNSAVEKLLRHCTKRLVFHAAVIISTERSDAIHTVAHSGKTFTGYWPANVDRRCSVLASLRPYHTCDDVHDDKNRFILGAPRPSALLRKETDESRKKASRQQQTICNRRPKTTVTIKVFIPNIVWAFTCDFF